MTTIPWLFCIAFALVAILATYWLMQAERIINKINSGKYELRRKQPRIGGKFVSWQDVE